MKRIFLFLLVAMVAVSFANATENQSSNTLKNSKLLKTGNDRFALKAQGIMGFYIDLFLFYFQMQKMSIPFYQNPSFYSSA